MSSTLLANDDVQEVSSDERVVAPNGAEDTVSDTSSTAVGGQEAPVASAACPGGMDPSGYSAPSRPVAPMLAMPGVPHIPIPTFIRYGCDSLVPDLNMHAKDVWWGGALYRSVPGTVMLDSSHGPTACTIVPATSPIPFRSSFTGANMGYVHVRPVTLFRQSQTPGNDATANVNFAQPIYCFSVEFICSAMEGVPCRVLFETVISAPPLMPQPVAVVP